jgi:hypothetical protein
VPIHYIRPAWLHVKVIAVAGEGPEVVLEGCYGWYWAVDVLQAAGARVHLAHPLATQGDSHRLQQALAGKGVRPLT